MNFNLNKLTVKAQEAVQTAIEIAQNYSNQIIEPEHLLAASVQDCRFYFKENRSKCRRNKNKS